MHRQSRAAQSCGAPRAVEEKGCMSLRHPPLVWARHPSQGAASSPRIDSGGGHGLTRAEGVQGRRQGSVELAQPLRSSTATR